MVQGWDGNCGEDGKYVAYRCPACGGLHLVNPKTGKLLADERGEKKNDDKGGDGGLEGGKKSP